MSSVHWQNPEKFNPDRFDPLKPDSKTPDGKKRHQSCWLPFGGGKRVCFGKTFAENVLRMTASIMSQSFNFELVNKELYDADHLPLQLIGQSHQPKNPLILTKYSKND